MPGQLSGGQRQRVALSRRWHRAIPSSSSTSASNVDAKVPEHPRWGAPAPAGTGLHRNYDTHDQVEAMVLGERVAILREGKVAQFGSPREVSGRPVSRYVADFVGAANGIEGTVAAVASANVVLTTAIGRSRAPRGGWLAVGQLAVAVIRPRKRRWSPVPSAPATAGRRPWSPPFLGPCTEPTSPSVRPSRCGCPQPPACRPTPAPISTCQFLGSTSSSSPPTAGQRRRRSRRRATWSEARHECLWSRPGSSRPSRRPHIGGGGSTVGRRHTEQVGRRRARRARHGPRARPDR